MTALAILPESSELVATLDRARALFDEGDYRAALLISTGAYEQAKAAAGYAEKVKASRELVDKARRMQADALKIESLCYVAMADAVDEAQAKGELSRGGRPEKVQGSDRFTLEDVGLDKRRLHEARQIRNAERAEPGFIDRVVEARVESGLEPSRAALKQSAGHAIGTKSATKEEKGDQLYETPVEAVRMLLALESFSAVVLEPSVGRGAILRPLEAAGYDVRISDLVDREIATQDGELQAVGDFLKSRGTGEVGPDIVTNPPYGDVANAYIAHALREHRPRKMALLLNLNFLCGFDDPDRRYVMDENPPSRVYINARRLPMMHRDGWDGPQASSQMNTAWFIWERNDDGSYGKPGTFQGIRVDWAAFKDAKPLAPGAGGFVAPIGFAADEFARETPRKTLDERLGEERARALIWIAEQPSFDVAGLRRGIAVRPTVADALMAEYLERGLLEPCDGGWKLGADGWTLLGATAAVVAGGMVAGIGASAPPSALPGIFPTGGEIDQAGAVEQGGAA